MSFLLAVLVGWSAYLFLGGRGLIERALADRLKWQGTPHFAMRGGLGAYWSVSDRTETNRAEAYSRGFLPLSLINSYADYPGNQKQNIYLAITKKPTNPWARPPFFESTIRRNITRAPATGVFVNDIELDFEEDARRAWSDSAVRQASRIKSFADFELSYYAEWAKWFSLANTWAKELRPKDLVGIYGPQPFRRDYWGISGRTAAQIDGAHAIDERLWNYIEPSVDLYVASIYVFYARPDSVFYMAANVEENFLRTRRYGDKPVFAFVWLRYHDSNRIEGNRELDPYLVEATAIVPYFSGARATVLWGHEPQLMPGDGRPYSQLPLYMSSLGRIAALSDKIGDGYLIIDEPAHQLWRERRPIVRRIVTADGSCVVMAANPWQREDDVSTADVACGDAKYLLEMQGRHVSLAVIASGRVKQY